MSENVKLESWKLVITSIVAVLVVLIPLSWNLFMAAKPPVPVFAFASPTISSNDALIIYAVNDAAKVNEPLHVEWNGFSYFAAAKKRNDKLYSWSFIPSRLFSSQKQLAYGDHKVRFRFSNGSFSEFLKVRLSNTATVAVPQNSSAINTLIDRPTKKVALVIGNRGYKHSYLKSSIHDARLIATRLKIAGFEVTEGYDLKRDKMLSLIQAYQSSLGKNDISVQYFAGYGLQLEGVNYLFAIDANLTDANDIRTMGITMETMSGVSAGLENQTVFLAASPSSMALDSGPFAKVLGDELLIKDKPFTRLVQDVSRKVKELTAGKQIPMIASTMGAEVVLNKSSLNSENGAVGGISITILDSCSSSVLDGLNSSSNTEIELR